MLLSTVEQPRAASNRHGDPSVRTCARMASMRQPLAASGVCRLYCTALPAPDVTQVPAAAAASEKAMRLDLRHLRRQGTTAAKNFGSACATGGDEAMSARCVFWGRSSSSQNMFVRQAPRTLDANNLFYVYVTLNCNVEPCQNAMAEGLGSGSTGKWQQRRAAQCGGSSIGSSTWADA